MLGLAATTWCFVTGVTPRFWHVGPILIVGERLRAVARPGGIRWSLDFPPPCGGEPPPRQPAPSHLVRGTGPCAGLPTALCCIYPI